MRILGLTLAAASIAMLLVPGEPELRLQAHTALDNDDFPRAIALYQTALRRDPASPYRWADLAEAWFASGDTPDAEKSFQRARQLGPHIPPIWIRDANFHFATGNLDQALTSSARVLATVPDYDAILFSSFDRLVPDPSRVISAIGSDRRSSTAYFQHLIDTNAAASAQSVWPELLHRNFINDQLASSYVDLLLRNHLYDKAGDTWAAYLGPRRGDFPDRNLLFNGSFETEPTGSPFDWTIQPSDEIDTSRDKTDAKDRAWSVRIKFHGDTNALYENVRQTARVNPGSYRLRAWIKTENITTYEGIRLRVFDPENPAHFDFRTNSITGSHPWLPVFEFVEIPAGTNLVTVEVFRAPSRFDEKISGTAWIDQVSLMRD